MFKITKFDIGGFNCVANGNHYIYLSDNYITCHVRSDFIPISNFSMFICKIIIVHIFQRDSTYSTTSTNGYGGDDDDNFQDDLEPTAFQRNLRQYSTYPPPTDRHKHKYRPPVPLVSIESQEMFPASDTSEYQSEEGFEGFGESFSEATMRQQPVAERSFHGYGTSVMSLCSGGGHRVQN